MVKVKIEEAESEAVEKLFYEQNAYMGLIQSIGAKDELVDKYAHVYVQLEKLKNALDVKYRPKDIDPDSFEFDFVNHAINYE